MARPLNDDEAKEFASSKKNENSPVKRTFTFEEASTPAEEKPWEKYKASRTKNDLAPAITGDMPNGYSIVFSPLLSANERDQIGKRYNEMLNIKLSHVRSLFLVKALFFWLIPVIFSYTCGWSLGWIYRGFKK